jgi:hypothetical protein
MKMKKKFSLLAILLLVFPISVFAVNDLTFDENVTVEITTTDEADDVTFMVASGSNFTEIDVNDTYVDLTLDAGSDLIVLSDGESYFEFEVQSGSGSDIPECPNDNVRITSEANTVVRLTMLSVDPGCEEEEEGSGGGGSSSSGSARVTFEDELDTSLSYADEVKEVVSKGLVEKELEKQTDKCEALMIMGRALDWNYDASVIEDGFTDTPAWCKPVAKYAKDMGYISGRSEGILGLDSPMNRFEFVVILYRILDGEPGSAKAPYSDTVMTWAAEAVNWAYVNGYMKGFNDGTFGGEFGILKQDVGVVMLRISK